MNVELLSKKYNKATELQELINTKGYQRLREEKLAFVNKTEREMLLNGLKPNYELEEKVIEGRTYLRLFDEIENCVAQKDKWQEQLKDSGISVR